MLELRVTINATSYVERLRAGGCSGAVRDVACAVLESQTTYGTVDKVIVDWS
ncbi:hypothetical protein [Mycobacterium leprae]|uniref:hypothetical protein n=1 Tax=Mycobacterium leprae TaxID=1769 RepID=UPI0002D78726|nr:hypothetical protein [Mycobacterium leprae]